jgi:hypothetical protein
MGVCLTWIWTSTCRDIRRVAGLFAGVKPLRDGVGVETAVSAEGGDGPDEDDGGSGGEA